LHLAKNAVAVPCPILDKSGVAIVDLKDKKSAIVSFLQGSEAKNITANHCFEVGKFLAKMHLAAADFAEKRENDLGINFWRPLFSKFEHLLDGYQIGLKKEILENLDFLEKSWKLDLQGAAVHLDLFPDNIFFDRDEKVCGAIDFYFAANDALIYDFAVTMVAWCDNEEKFLGLFRGYEEVRKFSEAEKDFLKIALVGAAMRFLLTRLHDMFFTPAGSFVKVKDPQEYLKKLKFFRAQL
jgi:homoserine kinase type II